MRMQIQKLTLNRETLRHLDAAAIRAAEGDYTDGPTCGKYTCNATCAEDTCLRSCFCTVKDPK